MIFFDTETCGLHGPTVLIQWAENDGEINLHDVWYASIRDTIELIEMMCVHEGGVCGFNLAFDWFHISQTYTVLMELINNGVCKWNDEPIDFITEYALAEPAARDGQCLKPQTALDLWLHARKGPYQTTMDRSDIRIKRVPTELAYILAAELGERIPLKDVYFARYRDKKRRWQVYDLYDDVDRLIPGLKDIVLKFNASSGLKALAHDALGLKDDDILKFQNIEIGEEYRPKELGYAPFALALGTPENWKGTWPIYLRKHAAHWRYHRPARKYAEDDVVYTRGLFHYFGAISEGCSEEVARSYANGTDHTLYDLEAGDTDSILACMVASIRWHGFKIDVDKLTALRVAAVEKKSSAKYNFNSPAVCITYLEQVLDEMERLALKVDGKTTTKGIILEELAKMKVQDVCDKCKGMGCKPEENKYCDEGLAPSDEPHPVASRAREILDFRHLGKRIEMYNKLIIAGRFHASFKVIGTLSSRMAGGDGLNAQGIPHEHEIRSCFPLSFDDMVLSGGDFDGFEVCLADAVYGDPELRKLLESGYKIHGLFGQELFPGYTYEEIRATDGLPGEKNLYSRSKQGVFALLYGGEGFTLANRVGVPEEVGNAAYTNWCAKFTVWGENRAKTFNDFCSMRQPSGIGTRVEWHDPLDYAESMYGFRRYFTLENQIVKTLYGLANSTPKHLANLKIKVVRRDREQTATGAMKSALLASAFAIQASNMRAAANHEIQSSGATLTKELQARLWTLQPCGIGPWLIMPMNIHDEIMAPNKEKVREPAAKIVDEFVIEHRERVPLLGITWAKKMKNWAEK